MRYIFLSPHSIYYFFIYRCNYNVVLQHVVLCYNTCMQTTIYIRKENEDKWNALGKEKSNWVNEQLSGISAGFKAEPVYEAPTPRPENKFPTIADLPDEPKLKVLTNDDLKALLANSDRKPIQDEPRHVCKDNCKHWVWDTNSGKYTNSLTGEVRDAPEF